MAIVRKRAWTGPAGEHRTAWLVDYRDQAGKRRHKQFEQKKAADAYLTKVKGELIGGVHIAESQSITVAAAAENWLKRARLEELEPATIDSYDQHVRLHIAPFWASGSSRPSPSPRLSNFGTNFSKMAARAIWRGASSAL